MEASANGNFHNIAQVIMTASRAAAEKVKALLTPELQDIGLAEEGEPQFYSEKKDASKDYASSDIKISGKEPICSEHYVILANTNRGGLKHSLSSLANGSPGPGCMQRY